MKKTILLGVLTLGLMIAVTSCSSVPQEKIDTAKAAVDSAKVAGADLYMTEAFTALQDSLNVTLASLENQKSKFLGNSSEVKTALDNIVAMAAQVQGQTIAIKEEMKIQIITMVGEINVLIEENKQLVASAPKGKEGTAALQAITGEITVLEASVTEISPLVEAGDLLTAMNKSTAIKSEAEAIKAELSEVIAKYQQAVKRR